MAQSLPPCVSTPHSAIEPTYWLFSGPRTHHDPSNHDTVAVPITHSYSLLCSHLTFKTLLKPHLLQEASAARLPPVLLPSSELSCAQFPHHQAVLHHLFLTLKKKMTLYEQRLCPTLWTLLRNACSSECTGDTGNRLRMKQVLEEEAVGRPEWRAVERSTSLLTRRCPCGRSLVGSLPVLGDLSSLGEH